MQANMIIVRFAHLGDFKKIKEYDEFMGDRRIDLQLREILVADVDGEMAQGFAKIGRNFLNRLVVEMVCVNPDFRCRGVATKLLEAIQKECAGCQIYATTEESNKTMQHLFLKIGWKRVGQIEEFNFSGERELIFRYGEWVF